MISEHKVLSVLGFLKIVLFATILIASSAHAIENHNYQSQSNIDVSQSGSINRGSKEQQLPITSCAAYFKETVNANNCRAGEVPLPAASWLFLLALIGFVGLSNKRKI